MRGGKASASERVALQLAAKNAALGHRWNYKSRPGTTKLEEIRLLPEGKHLNAQFQRAADTTLPMSAHSTAPSKKEHGWQSGLPSAMNASGPAGRPLK